MRAGIPQEGRSYMEIGVIFRGSLHVLEAEGKPLWNHQLLTHL